MNKSKILFEKVNKQIFVKNFKMAYEMLCDMLKTYNDKDHLLVHIKRIELAIKLECLTSLIQEYQKPSKNTGFSDEIHDICLAFINQQAGIMSDQDSIKEFNQLIEKYGESAPLYYGLAFSLESLGNNDRAITNYDICLKFDPNWYPAYFGLSQIYFRKLENDKGEYYFNLFEKLSPYSLYGNFYTHKNIAEEFLNHKDYENSKNAVLSLSEWWTENRGECPLEITIFECMMLIKISTATNNESLNKFYTVKLDETISSIINANSISESTLYYIISLLEGGLYDEIINQLYDKMIDASKNGSEFLSKIAQNLITSGKVDQAVHVFDKSYKKNPNREDLKYLSLLTKLNKEGVDVNYYLYKKNQIKSIIEEGYRTNVLKDLEDLISDFDQDSDVHYMIALTYKKMKKFTKAKFHFEKMMQLDGLNKLTALKYAEFLLDVNDIYQSIYTLEKVEFDEHSENEKYCELLWIRGLQNYKLNKYEEAYHFFTKILKYDPWNLDCLSYSIDVLTKMNYPNRNNLLEAVFQDSEREFSPEEWKVFNKNTEFFINENQLMIVYLRTKLSILYEGFNESSMETFVGFASQFDPMSGRRDLLKLLNTNFESPWIYLGLGMLSKEIWQLENAQMWFEYLIDSFPVDTSLRCKIYVGLSDCLVWQNSDLNKAIGYMKFVEEVSQDVTPQIMINLTHAYLKLGNIREAQFYLEKIPREYMNFEAQYLSGLLQYRNGFDHKAKEIWKPLLTKKSENLKIHNIKQALLKYYFDGEDYLKAS